jgi:hypothetical protein
MDQDFVDADASLMDQDFVDADAPSMDQDFVDADAPFSNNKPDASARTRENSQEPEGDSTSPPLSTNNSDAHTCNPENLQELESERARDVPISMSPDTPFTFDDFLFGLPTGDDDIGGRHPYDELDEMSDNEGDGPLLGGPISEGAQLTDGHDGRDIEEAVPDINPGPGLQEGVTGGVTEVFPRSGETKSRGDSHLNRLLKEQLEGGMNPYTPFRGLAEFELAMWLNELPLSKVDAFLRLQWVRSSFLSLFYLTVSAQVKGAGGTSFGSGRAMREQIDKLPKLRMTWKNVEVIPCSGTTSSPVFLCYRDPVEAIRYLLDRPSLKDHLTFSPERRWKDDVGGSRQYTEIMTGDWAWETQVSSTKTSPSILTG